MQANYETSVGLWLNGLESGNPINEENNFLYLALSFTV
jgi:hypothetical protein